MRLQNMNRFGTFGLAVLALAVVGCGGGAASAPVTAAPAATPKPVNFEPNVDAGVPVTQSADAAEYVKLAAVTSGKYPKHDANGSAFKLRGSELEYEAQQGMERVFSSSGFAVEYEEQEVIPPVARFEAAPFRRLSGIVVGVSVIALLEMLDGTTMLIRPGMAIPGTQWVVQSIDEEKAIMRRNTKENVQPKLVVVRLETAPIGTGFAPPIGGPGQGGPGQGAPGGVPPGGFAPGNVPPRGGGGGRNQGDDF